MLVGGLVTILLVAALIVVGLRMSDSTGGETAETSSPSPSQSSPSQSSPSSASSSDIEAREAELTEERGWTAGRDYIPSQAAQGRNAIDSIPALDEDSGMALGPADAPVTVRVFGDFSCPMCTRLHNESMPKLEEMARDGKIRLEWRNFPIFEDHGSDKAARGSIAAAAQGKLWEYLSAVYGAADDGDHPTYTDESVRALAESTGLDMDRFDADYGSEETTTALEREQSLAQSLGLTGTPTILIGYSYVSGAYPTDVLTNTIELQTDLAKK
ncbi:MAG: thioredoxin domain-containing protein [Actinomycetaceae bacterium]|nr:thioredoxin domain-containing protein [Actinomycetaceae bacterium]